MTRNPGAENPPPPSAGHAVVVKAKSPCDRALMSINAVSGIAAHCFSCSLTLIEHFQGCL